MPEPDWPPDPAHDPRTRIPDILREPPAARTTEPPTVARQFSEAGAAWGVAFNFIATVLGGVALGWLFDWWRGTGPWGVLVGLVGGFFAAAVQIIRYSLRQDRQAAARRNSH
ncbi:MAG: AtpZ/AtpI family protein [Phycisphaerales bacterium]|nr:AtpZ/AtpI family protein [Phycisphaerales bacterium]